MSPCRASWSVTPLGELVEVLDFARIPVSAPERAKRLGCVPYYGAAGQVGWIDKPLFDEPLVLLGEDGVQFFDSMKSKAYTISGPAWVNNHAHVLRARPAIDRRYLLHFLNQFDYRGFANGTTRLKLTQAAMKRMPINYPVLEDQRRIVDILEDHLSRLDAADQLLAAAHRRSDLLRAVSLESLAPKNTAPRTLGQLASDSGYGTSTKCVVDGPGVPVVRIPNLVGGRIDLADEKRVADATVDLTRLMLAPDDLLIVRTNGSRDLIGRAAVVQSAVFASFASYLIRFRLDPSQVRPQWTRVMLGTPRVRRALEAMAASSAGQYNLGLKKLNGVTIHCPPIEEQDRLLARFDEQEWALGSLTRSLAEGRVEAQSLRRSLLAAAFSGRLTGRSSDLEVAEELAAAGV